MSTTEKIDNTILQLIDNLVKEHGQTGFLSAPSTERKSEIIKEIATLRASMSPQCTPKQD